MKRRTIALLALLFTAALGLGAPLPARADRTVAQSTVPPADFGNPPSGEVPILFNDRHVYTKPDRLKADRVLAALVRGNTILVPLRSMFEQMGATVSYDPASKSADVSKPGADVKVTVGKPEVLINGESRPLDVPPEIYKGTIVVPVRVISESMGAYVQWVPEKKVVVVRYVEVAPPAPAPPPPPAPRPPARTPPPTPPPPPPPAPTAAPPAAIPYESFIVGDYLFTPEVYNEFAPNNPGGSGFRAVRAAVEFPLFNVPWMIEGDYRSWQYPHNTTALFGLQGANPCPVAGEQGCVTLPAGLGQYFFPAFIDQESDVDVRLGIKIINPHIYAGVGYVWDLNNTFSQFQHAYPSAPVCNVVPAVSKGYTGLPWCGYPVRSGIEYGLEKLPEFTQVFSLFGGAWYSPNVGSGSYAVPTAAGIVNSALSYRQLKYQIGIAVKVNRLVFVDIGYLGDLGWAKAAPSGYSHNALQLGIGLHF